MAVVCWRCAWGTPLAFAVGITLNHKGCASAPMYFGPMLSRESAHRRARHQSSKGCRLARGEKASCPRPFPREGVNKLPRGPDGLKKSLGFSCMGWGKLKMLRLFGGRMLGHRTLSQYAARVALLDRPWDAAGHMIHSKIHFDSGLLYGGDGASWLFQRRNAPWNPSKRKKKGARRDFLSPLVTPACVVCDAGRGRSTFI